MPIRECLVMAKPGGSRCNLSCDYCYYLGKEAELASSGRLRRGRPGPCPKASSKAISRNASRARRRLPVHFEWHGGEPTLLGLDYFRRIVRLQREHLGPGASVTNGLQTNGILIDEEWADFLASEGFSVGLSLDGPAALHDRYRKGPDGSGSHAKVMRAYGVLKERKVFCNLLCVLHEGNAARPEEVYSFFREIDAKYLQFLPLAPRPPAAGQAPARGQAPAPSGPRLSQRRSASSSAPSSTPGSAQDVGRVVVQTFDEALRPIYGAPHALCVHRETCGDVAVLERDGSFFACDHFVDRAHLIGNLERFEPCLPLGRPADGRLRPEKRDALPRACLDCEFLASCNGGCPKDRFVRSAEGRPA